MSEHEAALSAPATTSRFHRRRGLVAAGLSAAAALTVVTVGLASAWAVAPSSTVATSATITGAPAGTATVDSTLYARNTAALTVKVTTDSSITCVAVSGGAPAARQTAASGKTSWTFPFTAGLGDGTQTVKVDAGTGTAGAGCSGGAGPRVSYVLDNTGPVVTGVKDPAANGAGWNNTNVDVRWTATDTGSGVAGAQPYAATNVSSNGVTPVTSPGVADRVGNAATAITFDVSVDKAAPTIEGTASSPGYGQPTTVTFTCKDPSSGGQQESGMASCLADGSKTNSITVTANGTVTGTAKDAAGNTATASVSVRNVDTTAPTLRGAATTSPNTAGWYTGDVTVHWVASDPESGVSPQAFDTTIAGEGDNLTSTATVTNGAGMDTTGTSAPVKIDRHAPVTGISGTKDGWSGGDVTLQLSPSDGVSQVASTQFTVDGSTPQNGTTIALSEEGSHTVTYWSTDKAGNVEPAQTAHVDIDRTAPTIGHSFLAPLAYKDGAWTNTDVTVTFSCQDTGGSGLAACSGSGTTSTEGEAQQVHGTATDHAGHSADDLATVSIDKTDPTITAHAVGAQGLAGWYTSKVTVDYSAADALSGVADSPAADVLDEGRNQHATGTAVDNAGNHAEAGVTGIDVDTTPPSATADFSTAWSNHDVRVAWSCTDETSGIGVAPDDDVVTGEGANLTSSAQCADVAGNVGSGLVKGIRIDRHAPHTTASATDVPASGWYTDSVEVTLDATDALSSVASTLYTVDGGEAQTYSGPFTVIGEGAHQIVSWSRDVAGNDETPGSPLVVQVDATAPVTTATHAAAGASGWFRTGAVPVSLSPADGGSGVATSFYAIDGGTAVTYQGPFVTDLPDGKHTIAYWSADKAGHVEDHADGHSFSVDVDTHAPTLTASAVTGTFVRGAAPTPVCSATDSVSGLASCAVEVTGGTPNGVGTFNYLLTATDTAGNTATDSGTFRVVYRFDGFLQPITDTAHQKGPISVFKAGSTVPVKFQVLNADGTAVIETGATQTWLEPTTGTAVSTQNSGTARWDASGQQFIYNWKAPTKAATYKLGVLLDDGTPYYVTIQVK